MSRIIVDSLRGNSASSDAITLANDGTCTANITNNLSNRRININGQMSVWQRGTSITSAGYSPDRYYQGFSNAGSITHTISRQDLTSSDTPFSSGFRYFQRHALSAAGTANANAEVFTQHTIEAQDLAQSGWNYTSTSSYLTISFWVRVSTSQKFYLNLRTRDGTEQAYNIPFTPSANTWTKVTAQVPGNSNIQIDNNNDKGLHLNFFKFRGTDNTGGSSENEWAAYSSSTEVPDMASTWLTAGASTFDLTGLQVEVSDYPTSFEFLSFADELRRCQRYFETSYPTGYSAGHDFNDVYPFNTSKPVAQNYIASDDTTTAISYPFMVNKRANPTVTIYSAKDGASGNAWTYKGTGGTSLNVALNVIQSREQQMILGCSLGAVNQANEMYFHYTANSEL